MDIFDQVIDNSNSNSIKKANDTNVQLNNNNELNYDVFDQIFDNQEEAQNLQVKRSLQAVMKKDPNMVAEGLHLANELGLNKNYALDSNEAIRLLKEKKELKRIEELQLAKSNPILQRQLTDPAFAALAYDNIPNLVQTENLWESLKGIPEDAFQGIRKGVLSREKGIIGNRLRNNKVPFISVQDGFDLDYVPT